MGQPSLTVTSSTGELVVDCVNDDDAGAGNDVLVQGGSQTLIFYQSLGAGIYQGAGSDAAGAATVTMTWSGVAVGNPWCQIGVSLLPAPSPGVPFPTGLRIPNRMNGPMTLRKAFHRTVTAWWAVPAIVASAVRFRKTLSGYGSGAGKRQTQGTM